MTTVLAPPRVTGSVPQRRRHRKSRRVSVSSLAPLILSVSVAIALARLMSDAMSGRVLVPVLVAIALADVVTALALRLSTHVVLAVAVGWVIALCVLLVVVDPSVFNPGSSHFLHASVISDQLRVAHAALVTDGTPLPALNGIVIILGAIGAAAAALTRGIWLYTCRRPFGDRGRGPLAPCVAPSAAIFLYTTLVSAERSRVPAGASYFLGVLIFVALADRATTSAISSSVADGGRGQRARWRSGGLVACVLVTLIVIAAGAGLSSMRLTVFHVTPPTPGVPSNLITGISLVDHLRATEITESHTVIFHDTSPVPTYWQVGTLSSFNGTEWLPSAQVRTALLGSAGALQAALSSTALPTPVPAQTFTARVTITDFASRLLPAPPGTLAVSGLVGGTAIEEEGVLASSPDVSGTSYTLTAPLDAGLPTGGGQLPSSDPRLALYTALPAEPAVVAQLAHQAVGRASTPAAEAQALVDWFRSGQFRYTLSPPPTTGANPLVEFLTVTKAGFCEQFAGAYGVLARSLGIPTRLVVGFTAGQAGPKGTFTVTGADAHVWPQVYLGPDAGWISVEPTPPAGVGTPTAEGVVGVSGANSAPAGTTTPSTAVAGTSTATPSTGSAPGPTIPANPSAGAGGAAHRRNNQHGAHRARRGLRWWLPLVAAVVVLLIGGVAIGAVRRRRAVAEALLGPDERVVQAWDRALGALRHRGVARRPAETPAEFASRLRVTDEMTGVMAETELQTTQGDAVASLAVLVELACYTPRPCTPAQAAHAHDLASTIVDANRSHRGRRTRPPVARLG
jgi:transglutaminase-like putative cysteine protease